MDDTEMIVRALESQMRKKLKRFRKRRATLDPDKYIVFAPASVIKYLRSRGNTKEDVIIEGYKMECRVGSYPDIHYRTK